MEILFINHSGFLITTKTKQILIDMFLEEMSLKTKDTKTLNFNINEAVDKKKPLYILVSHNHHDHFDKNIFLIDHPNKKYILSFDCKEKVENNPSIKSPITWLYPMDIYKDSSIFIKAYGSTDEGISFYIETDNKRIFHTGDLNNWHWNEDKDTTKEETMAYSRHYKEELEKITKDIKELDILFYPVDIRLGSDFRMGAIEFLKEIKVKDFIPMHMWGDFINGNKMKEYENKYTFKHHEINKNIEKIIL